jgi:hypothetical protein
MRLTIANCRWLTVLSLLALLFGCAGTSPNPPTVQAATSVDPATTQPSYWLEQPAQTLTHHDFDKLWRASEEAARDFLFPIDRTDYRSGLMTTRPVISSQWFEFWRPDMRDFDAWRESSLASIRRTVRFEFARRGEGTFEVSPKVLVERQTVAEQRITSIVTYRGIFTPPIRTSERPRGTRESDLGIVIPSRYWYPTGRDAALEAALIDCIQKKLALLNKA